ncbi:MAG: HEAT repeat domain-containing protein [Bdellovibrionota bacterium]
MKHQSIFFILMLSFFSSSWAASANEEQLLHHDVHVQHWITTLQTNPLALARKNAASFLGSLQDVRAVPVLIRALHDDQMVVRKEASIALGNVGDDQALRYLYEAKGTEVDQSVRREQDRAIEKIKARQDYQQKQKQRFLDLESTP